MAGGSGAGVAHVATALFDDRGRIRCVRQTYGARLWSLPGGGVEAGESPVAAAIRETSEETGLLVRVDHLVGIYGAGRPDRISLCEGPLPPYPATPTPAGISEAGPATAACRLRPDHWPRDGEDDRRRCLRRLVDG